MKLILTSFGLSHLTGRSDENRNLFYRMPPVSMTHINQNFMPDYSTLLLADKVIIDQQTYDRLLEGRHELFGDVSEMIRMLHGEGFVQIENFEKIISDNKETLQSILKTDLKELDLWVKPLKEAICTWSSFFHRFDSKLRNELPENDLEYQRCFNANYHTSHVVKLHTSMADIHDLTFLTDAIQSSSKRRKSEYRNVLKDKLSEYLSYVNSNLLLSYKLNAGFHDWQDFQPFYKEKFFRLAQDSFPLEKEKENVKKLFDISFPEFSNWNPKNVIKALKDSRIKELRNLIDDACSGKVEFDEKFANRVLSEVFKIESKLVKLRSIVSYITSPIGFIPTIGTPIQKAAEEAIILPIQKNKRQEYKWFYMISDLAK